MIIRIDSLEGLTEDIALYLGKSTHQLTVDLRDFRLCNCDNLESQTIRLRNYIRNNKRENLTQVFLCHISRQIGDPTSEHLLPLPLVLTSSTPLSLFLKKHDIECNFDGQDLIINYRGDVVDIHGLKGRLHNRVSFDYCVNGFQFLYDIKHTNGALFQWYGSQPEFLYDLDKNLNLNLCNEFQKESSVYCALGRLNVNEVSYTSDTISTNFEEDYIYKCLYFVWEYLYSKQHFGSNHILYTNDTQIVPIDRWVHESDILLFEDKL